MAKLCIIREINSAHGKKIHGHTFKIEVNFLGKVINDMVENLDFHEIEPQVDSVISKLDKVYLDEIVQPRATIENIAIYILRELKTIKQLSSVIVWEGPDKYVEILKEEINE